MNKKSPETIHSKYYPSANLKKIIKPIIACLCLVITLFGYMLFEPYWLETKITYFETSDLPPAFENYRILFLSDIHHSELFPAAQIAKVVTTGNNLKPDLILLGGDYAFRGKKNLAPAFRELKKLHAPDGVYGVLGNHDHWQSKSETLQLFSQAGFIALDNQAVWLKRQNQQIKIGGVGDLFEDKQNLQPTIHDVSESDLTILLSHNPDYAEKIKHHLIDLMLCGHTHGGQITFFGLWAPYIPAKYGQKYRTGLVNTGFTKVLISNGIGPVVLPMRFGARPQLHLIILKTKFTNP